MSTITQTISTLPVVIGRYDANFIKTADEFLNTLPSWANELNNLTTQINYTSDWINKATTSAFASSNYKGTWDSEIAYTKGSSVNYNGQVYFALEDTDAGDEPEQSAKWLALLTSGAGGQIYADLEFIDALNGIILIDRDDNKKYRLFIQSGNLGIEEV